MRSHGVGSRPSRPHGAHAAPCRTPVEVGNQTGTRRLLYSVLPSPPSSSHPSTPAPRSTLSSPHAALAEKHCRQRAIFLQELKATGKMRLMRTVRTSYTLLPDSATLCTLSSLILSVYPMYFLDEFASCAAASECCVLLFCYCFVVFFSGLARSQAWCTARNCTELSVSSSKKC